MELLEEYKRINRVEREYINLLNKAKEDIERKSKFNALESEVQQEVQELIDRKQEQREWYEEVRNEIMECFWKVDKTLSLSDIKALVPVVIKELNR